MERIKSDRMKAVEYIDYLIKRFDIVAQYTHKRYDVHLRTYYDNTNRKQHEVIVSEWYIVDTEIKGIIRKKHKIDWENKILFRIKVNGMKIESYSGDIHEVSAIEEFGDKYKFRFLEENI